MTQVKICGIQTFSAAEAAVTAKADYLGMVFIRDNPRAIDYQVREQILNALRPLRRSRRPQVIALIADYPIKVIHNLYNGTLGIDAVQLSGAETPGYCREAITETGAKLFKVIGIPPTATLANTSLPQLEALLKDYRQAGCQIILDCAADGLNGGSGQAFDWDIAAALSQKGHEFILSGGLTPENAAQAIARVQPWGVDVSSRVETDGVKDPEKIRQFIANAKAAA